MRSNPISDLEPEAVFSLMQWKEIAQSIPVDKVPLRIKRKICEALFAYDMECIAALDNGAGQSKSKKRRLVAQDAREHDALAEFVSRALAFRLALYRLQNFLRPFEPMMDRAERTGAEVYELQQYAQEKLKHRPKSKGGRPS